MKIYCGVIGCGRIGCGFDENNSSNLIKTHSKAYLKNPNSVLTSFADIDKKKLKKYGHVFNIKNLYTDPEEMFKKENLDCVSICTHAESHLPLTKLAIKHNIRGIIIEKPISNSLNNALKILDLCQKNKVILSINHQRRCDPFYHSIADFIRKNMKEIQSSRIIYGGGISNTGSHLFDVVRMLFGEASSIQAILSKNESNNKKDPNLDVVVKFKNKVVCNLEAVNTKNFGIFELDVLGTKNRINLNMITNKITMYEIGKKIQDYNALVLKKNPFNATRNATDIRQTINNVIDCIENCKEPMSKGTDGFKSLEMIVASKMSAEKNKEIHFPINNKNYKI